MKQVWELTKSEFIRAVSTDGPDGEDLRQDIAVRYGIVDYDYIIRDAVSKGVPVDTTIRKTAEVGSPTIVRIKTHGTRAVKSIRSFGESISRFLFE